MSYWKEEQLEKIINNTLKPTDTFKFSCKMCGRCCRNRSEPILMTGLDVFRIAQALQMEPVNVLEKYMTGYVGDDSHVPIFILKERYDGSCSLLRQGKCTVQDKKPVVCAIYPLGRYYSAEDKQIHYFKQEHDCSDGSKDGQEWTLQEWLDNFGLSELGNMSNAWNKMLMGVSTVTSKIDKAKIPPVLIQAMAHAMYGAYDINKKYEDQVEDKMTLLKEAFWQVIHKELKF